MIVDNHSKEILIGKLIKFYHQNFTPRYKLQDKKTKKISMNKEGYSINQEFNLFLVRQIYIYPCLILREFSIGKIIQNYCL